jgi:hypothetical protein
MTDCSYDSEQYGTTAAVDDDCDDIIVSQLASPSILIDGAGKLECIAAYM